CCGCDSQAGSSIAIDDQRFGQAMILFVRGDVAELRHGARARFKSRRPGVQFIDVGVGESVLILGCTATASYVDILLRLKKRPCSGNTEKFASKAVHNLIGRDMAWALIGIFESDKHKSGVIAASTTAGECSDSVNGRIVENHLGQFLLFVSHSGETDVLLADGLPAHSAGILLREEALWNDLEEIDIQEGTANGDAESQPLMTENPAQCRVVLMMNPLESILEEAIEVAVTALVALLEETRTQHGRGSEGDEHGNSNGHAEGDSKLAKELAHNAAHEQDGNEDGDQRSAHGEDGESDLL